MFPLLAAGPDALVKTHCGVFIVLSAFTAAAIMRFFIDMLWSQIYFEVRDNYTSQASGAFMYTLTRPVTA